MAALAADDTAGIACLSFPRVVDLDAPDGHCQQVCVPWQERRIQRFLHQTLHGRVPKGPPPRAGGPEDGADVAFQATGGDRVGGGKHKKKPGGKQPVKEKPPSRAYLAGKRLAPKEISRSVQRAPRGRSGKIIGWDACAWAGCPKTGATCARSREPIKGMANPH